MYKHSYIFAVVISNLVHIMPKSIRRQKPYSRPSARRVLSTRRRGGALYTFPIRVDPSSPGTFPVVTDGAVLRDAFDFYQVTGHASLTGEAFVVPPHTYLCFLTSAGFPCQKSNEIANNWMYAMTSDERYWSAMYDQIRHGTTLAHLFDPDKTNSENLASAVDDLPTSIYEPGDFVQDLNMTFKNDYFPMGAVGVWRLPIKKGIMDRIDTLNDERRIRVTPEDEAVLKNPGNVLSSKMFSTHTATPTASPPACGAGDGSVCSTGGAGYKQTLRLLLNDDVAPGTAAKPRILFLSACRHKSGDEAGYRPIARRLSIATRKRSTVAPSVRSTENGMPHHVARSTIQSATLSTDMLRLAASNYPSLEHEIGDIEFSIEYKGTVPASLLLHVWDDIRSAVAAKEFSMLQHRFTKKRRDRRNR